MKKLTTIRELFNRMNDVSYNYVVIRNWGNLPLCIGFEKHEDLDLLVYDLSHFVELFPNAVRTYKRPRVQYKIPIGDKHIQVDVRYIGDGYFPKYFQQEMLKTRVWNKNGFYTPNEIQHKMGISYHAVHHKNSTEGYEAILGNATVKDLLTVLQHTNIGWGEPIDTTVGRYNSYVKGATSIVRKGKDKIIKKQISYNEYSLLDNETRILKKTVSRHFPKILNVNEDSIEIEDCGEQLTIHNLPKDWQTQLIEIVGDLKKGNIQHRDIKPDNLMVKKGVIKLIDFGWSRFFSDPGRKVPECLGKPYRLIDSFDDNYSMRMVQKYYYSRLEEIKK